MLAGQLVRQHSAFDAKRFLFIENPEKGYEWWFGKELQNKKALILCAKLDGKLVGYAYARQEPRDWNALLDAHGALHDIFGAPEHPYLKALLHAVPRFNMKPGERLVPIREIKGEVGQLLRSGKTRTAIPDGEPLLQSPVAGGGRVMWPLRLAVIEGRFYVVR